MVDDSHGAVCNVFGHVASRIYNLLKPILSEQNIKRVGNETAIPGEGSLIKLLPASDNSSLSEY